MPEHAASQLLGRTLESGWTVIERLEPPGSGTAGYFSVGYVVEHADGRRGFLKALDYSRAFRAGVDTPLILKNMTSAYVYERNLLRRCRDRRFHRIVQILDEGSVSVSKAPHPEVDYLIFELADTDARSRLDKTALLDIAWALRTLHHMATALGQLHGENIAHQDVKPANVLLFGNLSKLGDLGRASQRGAEIWHDEISFPGDRRYAPPEFLYGYVSEDWDRRRITADLYQLGSLATFFFAQAGMTPLIIAKLRDEHRPDSWSGIFEEVLPYLTQAFAEVLEVVKRAITSVTGDEDMSERLTRQITYLCEPDPSHRGNPVDHQEVGNPSSLRRFVSAFNLIATRAEWRFRRLTT